jgi:hypothetical protein
MDEDAQMAAAIALSLAEARSQAVEEPDGTSAVGEYSPSERGAEVSKLLPDAAKLLPDAAAQPVEQLDVELQMVQPASPLEVTRDTANTEEERPSGADMGNADDHADELATTYSGNELPSAHHPVRRNLANFDATQQNNAEDPAENWKSAAARIRLERMRLQRAGAANLAASDPVGQHLEIVAGTSAAADASAAVDAATSNGLQPCMLACICVLLGCIIWLFVWSLRVL